MKQYRIDTSAKVKVKLKRTKVRETIRQKKTEIKEKES